MMLSGHILTEVNKGVMLSEHLLTHVNNMVNHFYQFFVIF